MSVVESIPYKGEELYLVGFRIDPDDVEPNLYTILVYGDNDRPIVNGDGQILFFPEPMLSSAAIQEFDANFNAIAETLELSIVYDIAEMLYLISSGKADGSAIILNCLNVIFDFVKVTKLPIPMEYESILFEFADYLTFDKDLETFFLQSGKDRSKIIDGVLWCIGAIFVRSRLMITAPGS
jgi:hypothetical protein